MQQIYIYRYYQYIHVYKYVCILIDIHMYIYDKDIARSASAMCQGRNIGCFPMLKDGHQSINRDLYKSLAAIKSVPIMGWMTISLTLW